MLAWRERPVDEDDLPEAAEPIDESTHGQGTVIEKMVTCGLVETLSKVDDPPSVRLLAGENVLKWLQEDFVLASAAAELIEAETLAVRAATEPLENTLVVTEETVVSLLTPDDDHSAALVTDDEGFVEAVRERWESAWEKSEAFDLRTPAYSRVLESLDEEFGSAVESDLDAVLETLGSTRDESVLDEVGVSLLVVARHGEMLYDVSHWGEDTGVASKATFQGRKPALKSRDCSIPRKYRSILGDHDCAYYWVDERLREADPEELPSVVRKLLSAAPA